MEYQRCKQCGGLLRLAMDADGRGGHRWLHVFKQDAQTCRLAVPAEKEKLEVLK
ncbi:MAG: hypothetical protein Q8O55_02340 [Dehalococcoidales bacterium]|nr:hypothetical protein [Dehalococcoidales bacterium]